MTLYKRGGVWWYSFWFAGRRIQESSKTESKTLARMAYDKRKRELQEGFHGIKTDKKQRVQTVKQAATAYLKSYALRNPASTPRYMKYNVAHLIKHLGNVMLIDIDREVISSYQEGRLKEGASGKTINEEVATLFRVMGQPGKVLRLEMQEEKTLRLKQTGDIGRALTPEEENTLLEGARRAESPLIYPALMIALNTAMRDSEIKNLTWGQVNLNLGMIVVGKSKTAAGTGRTIPVNEVLRYPLHDYRNWYELHIGLSQEKCYVFPFGRGRHWDPTKPITTFKTAWQNLKRKTGISVRFHDLRHTAITKLAESGAADETIMAIAGHVSRSMLARYSHIRTEAKRKALESIATKPVEEKIEGAKIRRIK